MLTGRVRNLKSRFPGLSLTETNLLCPLSKTLYHLLGTGLTQETSRFDEKCAECDV